MDLDHTFRMVLIVGGFLVLPIALYHRVKSQATREPLDRRKEGLFILLTLRPVGIITILGVIAYLIDPAYMAWSSWPLPAWVRWIGSGIGAAAGVLFLWSFHTLGKNLTDTVVTRREHTLVTDGPYRWVRHPFYDAVALCIVATSLIAANWFILLSGALAFALIVVRTRTEEEQLLARFGDSYRTYMQRTGRFLPRVSA
jgi:protein-S-isoprenylcysteine O-methyltransferase Ste14